MITENLSTLKINKLTREQYEAALEAGNINENEIYMTPEDIEYASLDYVNDQLGQVSVVINSQQQAINTANSNISNNTSNVNLLRKNWGTITIPVNSWSTAQTNGWFTNQVTVTDMTADYNPYADVVYTSSATVSDEDSAFGCIKEIETGAGIIIAKAIELPTIDVKIRLMGV